MLVHLISKKSASPATRQLLGLQLARETPSDFKGEARCQPVNKVGKLTSLGKNGMEEMKQGCGQVERAAAVGWVVS